MVLLPLFLAFLPQSPIDSAVGRFYDAHWFDPAPTWVQRNGVTRQATALLDVVAHADDEGLDPGDYLTPTLDSLLHRDLTFDDAWRLDTLLTRTFLTYAWDVSRGRIAPSLVDSSWTASPNPQDVVALLEWAPDAKGFPPPQPGYRALRASLQRYRTIARRGDWPAALGRRLALEGYDTTAGLPAAVQRFQTLHGLEPDGIVGPATQEQLDISPSSRARQIALNLERWRWLPRSLGDRYIVLNSAAFVLELVENGAVTFTTRAVVGRPDWPTPITSSRATDIVFRPVWKVPRTIAAQELLPIIRRDSTYLSREGFRIFGDSSLAGGELKPEAIDWSTVAESTFVYQLAQEPGPDNPLGGMKLVFWTPFSVFIHDTPARPLFSERWRAFSHGCVRVEDAGALVARLLPAWPTDSIAAAMDRGRQRWVHLPQSVPVHLVYWTAWVADDGVVAFAADPYGWDEKLARALDARAPQRVTVKGARRGLVVLGRGEENPSVDRRHAVREREQGIHVQLRDLGVIDCEL
jgi:L,D-transpeptidase YcbB